MVLLCMGMEFATVSTSLDDITSRVRKKGLAEKMGVRDTARCCFMEQLFKVKVYTLAKTQKEFLRLDHHILCNCNSTSLVHKIQNHLGNCNGDESGRLFSVILLMPWSYVHDRWGKKLRAVIWQTLLRCWFPRVMCTIHSTATSSIVWSTARATGVMSTKQPFSVVSNEDTSEMERHLLWKATAHIPDTTMIDFFVKEGDNRQLRLYCTTSPQDLDLK
jgi:hypothetical protein